MEGSSSLWGGIVAWTMLTRTLRVTLLARSGERAHGCAARHRQPLPAVEGEIDGRSPSVVPRETRRTTLSGPPPPLLKHDVTPDNR